ncbi:MAG: 16S rRNA m(6)2A1518,m(6)2A1519 dimethyltransferase [Candidatus Westeberhardia cardiocondylae]|nr:16S rRNA m(6)2A1518,m(6)2A1519 dimethyltransferase [Candidatus Westeberhardia cardiocondylae]
MSNYVYKNYRIKRRFGQNFLCSTKDITSVVDIINPKINDIMVEIGPGLGALTEVVLNFVNNLTIIEIDHDLINMLYTRYCLKDKIIFINQDVRKVNFFSLCSQNGGRLLRIFGSLPYNMAMSIIFYLSKYINCIFDMHFILQKEVANRLIAVPNSRMYGKLSVMAQYFYNVFVNFDIYPESFRPIPKVCSTLVHFVPSVPLIPVHDVKYLRYLINFVFSRRRKTLWNSLRYFFSREELQKNNIDIFLRAENLYVRDYCILANMIYTRINI